MPKPTIMEILGTGGNEYMMTRKLAFEKAEPLSDHINSCLEFLKRVDRVEATEIHHKLITLQVHEKDAADKEQVWFTITRRLAEVSTLHSHIHRWADSHIDLSMYDIAPCGYCKPLTNHKQLWPYSIDSLLTFPKKRLQVYSRCITSYVELGRGSVDHDRTCFGIQHIPSILGRFLLVDVDQTTL